VEINLKKEQLVELMLDIYRKGYDSSNVTTEQILRDIIQFLKEAGDESLLPV
jgi:hypothetical protein